MLLTVFIASIVCCSPGCGSPERPAADADQSRANPQDAPAPGKAILEVKGGNVVYKGKDSLNVYSVQELSAKAGTLSGLIAIRGKVSESFPDRRAFVLVDSSQMAACEKNCCPQVSIPIRIQDKPGLEVPGTGTRIFVVADLKNTPTGFELDVKAVEKDPN